MRLFTVAALALTGLASVALVLGTGAPAAAAAPAAADDLRSTISVVGDGRVLAQPDVAHVNFGVEASGQTFEAAQADAATRMQAVVDTLIGLGIPRVVTAGVPTRMPLATMGGF